MKIESAFSFLVIMSLACGGGGTPGGGEDPGPTDSGIQDIEDASSTDVVYRDEASEPSQDSHPNIVTDSRSDAPPETVTPVCLSPKLPKSCVVDAMACTGLTTCGPTVTSCFQYGLVESPEAAWLVADWIGGILSASSFETMRIEFSNGAWMLSEFLPMPRALYFAPDGNLCARLDVHLEENSGNWTDSEVARRWYLRYGDGKVIVIRPRFLDSPEIWWNLAGFDVECPDGSKESWDLDQFAALAFLFFGGESHDGRSFLPLWTADGCRLGEYDFECLHPSNPNTCIEDTLSLCQRGAKVTVDCLALGKQCVRTSNYAFCWGGETCIEDGCDGDRISRCWDSFAEMKDCGEIGATCVVRPGVPPYTSSSSLCVQAPARPCVQKDFVSRCDGDVVVRCEHYGYEMRVDCAKVGTKCHVRTDEAGASHAFCAPQGSGPCDEHFQASCEGDVLRTCVNQTVVVEEDCKAKYAKTCKVGPGGPACVDPPSEPCENKENNCVGCAGDYVVACGVGGLTVFDDCTRQGLATTDGVGRTCVLGAEGCGVCAQAGAGTCEFATFESVCVGPNILSCEAGVQILQECVELFYGPHVPGWCNTNPYGHAYCEPMSVQPCDPATTPSSCEPGPIAVNCTESKVLEKQLCVQAGLDDCRLNEAGKAVCVQSGAEKCDPATFQQKCKGQAAVTCADGFTLSTPCPSNLECGVNSDGQAVCHQVGADKCDWMFEGGCEGETAVTCEDGFVRKVKCPDACYSCTCHEQFGSAWCAPSVP